MTIRATYQAKLKTNVAKLEAEAKRLGTKADKAKADAKVKLDMEVAILKAQHKVAKAHMKALKRASDEAWDDIRLGAERAWADLGHAFTSARKRF